jgi:DNA (cytosine-5)-methyltransferase 1
MPEIAPHPAESWFEHSRRLTAEAAAYRRGGRLRYRTRHQLLQAADYGVPQLRERVFVVAYREDLGTKWVPPPPTHSEARLLHEMYATFEYWDEHGLPRRRFPEGLPVQAGLATQARWRTVRDAIKGLPEPSRRRVAEHNETSPCEACHWGNPGARPYHGHEGSDRDWPAKTLKAGVHGVPGGENMLRNSNGTVRYFTAREAARIQTFPDEYHFPGTWGEVFRQLGNAVPVAVGRLIAQQIAIAIKSAKHDERAESMKLVASG